jgi:hypothetical protein
MAQENQKLHLEQTPQHRPSPFAKLQKHKEKEVAISDDINIKVAIHFNVDTLTVMKQFLVSLNLPLLLSLLQFQKP